MPGVGGTRAPRAQLSPLTAETTHVLRGAGGQEPAWGEPSRPLPAGLGSQRLPLAPKRYRYWRKSRPCRGPTSCLYGMLRFQSRRALTSSRDPSGPRTATRPDAAGSQVQRRQRPEAPEPAATRSRPATAAGACAQFKLYGTSAHLAAAARPLPLPGRPPLGPKDRRVHRVCLGSPRRRRGRPGCL